MEYVLGLDSSRFPLTAESIVDALRSDDDSDIMGYQVYVAVAWLREEKLLVPLGRQGYTVADRDELRDAVERLWNALPTCD